VVKRFLALLTTMLPLILTFPVLAQRPDAPPYALGGEYAVGVMDATLTDNPDRPLTVSIWYPAEATEGEAPTYRTGLFAFAGGEAVRDAELDERGAPYPLVVYSHGSGSHRAFSLFLMEHLASHGFVVIAPDHPTNTALDLVFNEEAFDDNLASNYIHRPDDLLRVIEYAETMPQMIDINNTAVMGHSFGGYTALAAAGGQLDLNRIAEWCSNPTGLIFTSERQFAAIPNYREVEGAQYNLCFLEEHLEDMVALRGYEDVPDGLLPPTTDPRIRAVVALAPWNAPIFGESGLTNVTVPALVIVGSEDRITPPERDAYVAYERLGSVEKSLAVFENADHFIYIDSCRDFMLRFGAFGGCSDPVWDMQRAHDLINHLTTPFLRSVLYGEDVKAETDFRGVVVVEE
jgi:predicted dienelactone hydrolase